MRRSAGTVSLLAQAPLNAHKSPCMCDCVSGFASIDNNLLLLSKMYIFTCHLFSPVPDCSTRWPQAGTGSSSTTDKSLNAAANFGHIASDYDPLKSVTIMRQRNL